MIKKQYTYDSWLNDEIDIKFFGDLVIEKIGLGFLVQQGHMQEADYQKITEKQRWTFDRELDFMLKGQIEIFKHKVCNLQIELSEYLEIIIEELEQKFKLSEDRDSVLTGYKRTGFIKGSEYLKHLEYQKRELESPSFVGTCLINENLDTWVTFNFLQWVKNYRPVKQQKGYQSDLPKHKIDLLFDLLCDKYIDPKTNPEHFKAIFESNPLPFGFQKVRVQKKFTNALVAYFIDKLFSDQNPNDYWKIAESCFDVKNLRKSADRYYENKDHKPRGYIEIDAILQKV